MKDNLHPPTDPTWGPHTNPELDELDRQLTKLATELSGWTVAVMDPIGTPAIYGLRNVDSFESFEEVPVPLHVGVLPTSEHTYYVMPFTVHPVSVEVDLETVAQRPPSLDDMRIKWQLGQSDLCSVHEVIANPLTTIDQTVARVRHYCDRVP